MVAVLCAEWAEELAQVGESAAVRKVDAQHGAALVRLHALDFDLAKRGGDQQTTGQINDVGEIFLPAQFINRGTPHHSRDRDLRPYGRDKNGVARLQAIYIGTDPAQQEFIKVGLVHQLRAAQVFDRSQRAARRRSSP